MTPELVLLTRLFRFTFRVAAHVDERPPDFLFGRPGSRVQAEHPTKTDTNLRRRMERDLTLLDQDTDLHSGYSVHDS